MIAGSASQPKLTIGPGSSPLQNWTGAAALSAGTASGSAKIARAPRRRGGRTRMAADYARAEPARTRLKFGPTWFAPSPGGGRLASGHGGEGERRAAERAGRGRAQPAGAGAAGRRLLGDGRGARGGRLGFA